MNSLQSNRNPGGFMKQGKSGPLRAFRPWPENQERLEYAEKLGLNLSELINEALKRELRDQIQRVVKQKADSFRKALDAPVP